MRKIQIATPSTGEEEWQAVREPILSGWLTAGPKVRAFEEAFAERHDVKHAVAVTSATTALHLSLVALGIGEGDEVIVPAFTWVATANVVEYVGAKVVFADIDLKTFNLDPAELEDKVTERTKAIIPVHLFGLCANMDEIQRLAPDIPLIEDAACAAGAALNERPAGSLGTLGCFSFHPRKSITTGEGGMITTDDDDLAELLNRLRNHGASISEEQRHHGPRPHLLPDFDILGFNYRMTDLQAAVGLVQLSKLDRFIDEREQWARFYRNELADVSWLALPEPAAGYRHGWQSFVTLVDASVERDVVMDRLQEKGIATRPGTHAVHTLGYYREKHGIRPEEFPNALTAQNQSMAIPLHNRMAEEDFQYVVTTLKAL